MKIESDKEYEIESAAECIKRAETIKADSELMEKVEKFLKKDVKNAKKAYKSIANMRDEYSEMDDD